MNETQTHDETTTDVVHVFNVTTKEWGRITKGSSTLESALRHTS